MLSVWANQALYLRIKNCTERGERHWDTEGTLRARETQRHWETESQADTETQRYWESERNWDTERQMGHWETVRDRETKSQRDTESLRDRVRERQRVWDCRSFRLLSACLSVCRLQVVFSLVFLIVSSVSTHIPSLLGCYSTCLLNFFHSSPGLCIPNCVFPLSLYAQAAIWIFKWILDSLWVVHVWRTAVQQGILLWPWLSLF